MLGNKSQGNHTMSKSFHEEQENYKLSKSSCDNAIFFIVTLNVRGIVVN